MEGDKKCRFVVILAEPHFNLRKEAIHAALDQMVENDQNHFNAPCPRCRKANRVSKQQLLRAAPNWVVPAEREESEEKEQTKD